MYPASYLLIRTEWTLDLTYSGGGDPQRRLQAELLRQAGGDRLRGRRQLAADPAAVWHRAPRGATAGKTHS